MRLKLLAVVALLALLAATYWTEQRCAPASRNSGLGVR
jgi:hypothetical protein